MGIFLAAWLLILAGSVIVFRGIAPIPDLFEGGMGVIVTAVLKAFLAALLVLLWVWVLVKLRNMYVMRKLLSEHGSDAG